MPTSREEYYKRLKERENWFQELIKDREYRLTADLIALIIHDKCIRNFTKLKASINPPPVCEECGLNNGKSLHAHHEDYSQPLNIKYLCGSCHRKIHGGRSYQEFYPDLGFERSGREGKLGNTKPFKEAVIAFKKYKKLI